MRVHSTFNNTLSVHQKASKQAEKGAIVEGGSDKAAQQKNRPLPQKENLSRSQILARVKNMNQEGLSDQQKDVSQKAEEPDLERPDALKRASWDVEDISEEKITELNKKANEKAKKLAESKTGVKVTLPIKEDEPIGDVGSNQPDDPLTRSKLKQALNVGSFQFNEKEREALSNILKE